jgi:hypothetical protein
MFVLPDDYTLFLILGYLLFIVIFLRGEVDVLEKPSEIWCVFKWLGCKEKRP